MMAKVKIVIFMIVVFACAIAYSKLFQSTIDSPKVASWWLKDVIVKKEQISDTVKGERIIILSGSNGLFGFDGNLLSKKAGMPVVNLALHASLDINFYKMIAERNIRKGDIVILPIEYTYYTLNDSYNTWFIDNMIAWGGSYLRWIDPVEYWKFISHVDLQKVVSGSFSNYLIKNGANYKSKLHSEDEIHAYNNDGSFHEYDFKSIDSYGGILAPAENKRDALAIIQDMEKYQGGIYYTKNLKQTKYGISSVIGLVRYIEKMGATAVLTWPTSMKTQYFNKDDPQSNSMINTLTNNLKEHDIEIYCSPWSVNLDPKLFYDTAYHLNKEGARIRTEAVYSCLKHENLLTPSN